MRRIENPLGGLHLRGLEEELWVEAGPNGFGERSTALCGICEAWASLKRELVSIPTLNRKSLSGILSSSLNPTH